MHKTCSARLSHSRISMILFHLYSTIPPSQSEAPGPQTPPPLAHIPHLLPSDSFQSLLPSSHPETVSSWFSSIRSFLASCSSSRNDHSNSYFLYVFTCYNRMAGSKISNDHSSFLSPFSEASFIWDIPVVPTSCYFSPVSRSQSPSPTRFLPLI